MKSKVFLLSAALLIMMIMMLAAHTPAQATSAEPIGEIGAITDKAAHHPWVPRKMESALIFRAKTLDRENITLIFPEGHPEGRTFLRGEAGAVMVTENEVLRNPWQRPPERGAREVEGSVYKMETFQGEDVFVAILYSGERIIAMEGKRPIVTRGGYYEMTTGSPPDVTEDPREWTPGDFIDWLDWLCAPFGSFDDVCCVSEWGASGDPSCQYMNCICLKIFWEGEGLAGEIDCSPYEVLDYDPDQIVECVGENDPFCQGLPLQYWDDLCWQAFCPCRRKHSREPDLDDLPTLPELLEELLEEFLSPDDPPDDSNNR